MTPAHSRFPAKSRWLALVVIAVLVLGFVAIYAVQAYGRYQARTTGASAAAITGQLAAADRIIFRNTALGEGYGQVASVALAEPSGPRQLSQQACDRVDATSTYLSCLRTKRGIPTTFHATVFNAQQHPVEQHPLSGVPSRTRITDGGLVATTAFVTGHSYAAGQFSTETTIRSVGGPDYGNLEDFSMDIQGKPLTAVDRNVWGVSFLSEKEFYATVASGNQTWLAKGDLDSRSLVSVASNAECPSVSPEGSKVAYKKRRAQPGLAHWDIAVLDLETRKETVIGLELGFDDQLEWLDEGTLLFGMPRAGAPGDSDVFSIEAQANATAQLFIEHAWSPSVVRAAQ
ncbi:hypothetical protein [Glutamicibacter sp. 2E12]|uniref:hypothetical protein n=1 Tax=Glutamicibacter sp. 2E12 TaxID=3416181 RepID=UPI003CEC51BD